MAVARSSRRWPGTDWVLQAGAEQTRGAGVTCRPSLTVSATAPNVPASGAAARCAACCHAGASAHARGLFAGAQPLRGFGRRNVGIRGRRARKQVAELHTQRAPAWQQPDHQQTDKGQSNGRQHDVHDAAPPEKRLNLETAVDRLQALAKPHEHSLLYSRTSSPNGRERYAPD